MGFNLGFKGLNIATKMVEKPYG